MGARIDFDYDVRHFDTVEPQLDALLAEIYPEGVNWDSGAGFGRRDVTVYVPDDHRADDAAERLTQLLAPFDGSEVLYRDEEDYG